MKLTFLGTSAGKPTKERNVSALGLEFEGCGNWYLFDCGDGTQRQILQTSLSLAKLSAIFITHLHGDHYYGLPGLLSTKKLDASLNPMTIYGPRGIKEFLEIAIDASKERLGFALEIIEYEYGDEFVFDKFSLKVLPLVHSKESAAFYVRETAGRKLIIAGDNAEPDVLGDYLQNIDLLVHECTFTQETYDNLKKKFLHTTAKVLGVTAQKRGVKNLIANHVSPRYDNNDDLNVSTLRDELKFHYEGNFFIAKDFDVYHLDKDGLLSIE